MMRQEQHDCRCWFCGDSELSRRLDPAPNHFSVPRDAALHVFQTLRNEGEHFIELTDVELLDCFQVIAGREGKAWRYREPIHFCQNCDRGVCVYVSEGWFWVASTSTAFSEGLK